LRVKRTPGKGADQLKFALNNLDGKVGKVGWFENDKYPNGTPVAYIATIQEYGDPPHNIPARPILRPTIIKHQEEWKEKVKQLVVLIIKKQLTIDQVMEMLGLNAAGDVRRYISTIQEPPLKDSTIAARLRQRADKTTVGNLTKPLVDTGKLLGSVSNTVENK
jgi:hypothetical protein